MLEFGSKRHIHLKTDPPTRYPRLAYLVIGGPPRLGYTNQMTIVLRALEFLGLSIWLGSDIFLSFVVAPGAFSVLASRDQAGAIVGFSLTRMHWLGIICGILVLLFRLVRTRSAASLASPAALCIALMILLTVASWYMWRAFERAGYAATNKIKKPRVKRRRLKIKIRRVRVQKKKG